MVHCYLLQTAGLVEVMKVEKASKTEGVASHISHFVFLYSFHIIATALGTLWDQSVTEHILSPNTLTTIVSNYLFLIWRLQYGGRHFGGMPWTSVSDGVVWRTECWTLSLRRLMGTLSPSLLSHPPPASCLERRMTTTCCEGKLELMSALFRSFWTRFIVHSLIVGLCTWGYSTDGLVSSSLASSKLTICLSCELTRGNRGISCLQFLSAAFIMFTRTARNIRLTHNQCKQVRSIFLLICSRWHL